MSVPITRRAGRREWVGLEVLALPCLLYAMDPTVLNLAVPQLSADLRPSSSQLLWIVDIYRFLRPLDQPQDRLDPEATQPTARPEKLQPTRERQV
jgi:hypothetical protein